MAFRNDVDSVDDWTLVNDDPLAFKNVHTGTIVGVRYSEERDSWVYGGPNTAWACDSRAEAHAELLRFVRDTRRPSGMV